MNMPSMLRAAMLAASFTTAIDASASNATAPEATAMVKKGIAFIKANGKEKGYAEVTNKHGPFVDRDLYIAVMGLDGVVRAHGANEKMIGKNLSELRDVDGKPFMREMLDQGQSKMSFWEDYKFTNPVSKKIEPKSMYCERLDDTLVCSGIYKAAP